ncbi:MAG: AAA family ATPase [Thermoplasmata archaeon]|nr:AAA family ATPase [Thermoplasmata archaeon]
MTVLFADLAGFTPFSEKAGEEAAFRLIERVATLVTESVRAYGGVVKSFTGDGAMAVFGAPSALEDAPLRACKSALLIQQGLGEGARGIELEFGIEPSLRIGIGTGAAILGTVPTGEGTGAAVLGDAVNLAARLERRAAPGTILLSESTYLLVRGQVEVEAIGEQTLRGKSEPQRAYRLKAVRSDTTRFDVARQRGLTPLVGRAQELAGLEAALRESRSAVRVVDLVGEAGLGKSRLLHEFRLELGRQRCVVLAGNCTLEGKDAAFRPFTEVIRRSFGVEEGAAPDVAAGRLESGLRSLQLDSPQNLGLLLNVLGYRVPGGILENMDPTILGSRTQELLRRLMEARSKRSVVVLIIEDLHWIDRLSADLLARLVGGSSAAPFLVVHSRRPEYEPAWRGQPNVTALRLGPLDPAGIQRIVESRLGVEGLSEAFARLLVGTAEGNPLFAEEIATFLLERGVVTLSRDGAAYDPRGSVALPSSLRSLLTARVDRLDAAERELLQVASVIGREFEPALLGTASGVPSDRVASHLDRIRSLDLVYPDARTGRWWFKHALVREVVYESILAVRRTALHLQVAREIERGAGDHPNVFAAALAYHYGRSPDRRRAFQWLAIAGRKSLDLYALEEAEEYYRLAFEILHGDPSCAEDSAAAEAMLDTVEIAYQKSDFVGILRLAEAHLPRLETFGDTPQLSAVLFFLCNALTNRCQPRDAEPIARRSLAIAERCGDARAIGRAWEALLYITTNLSRTPLEESERMGEEALRFSAAAHDDYNINWAHQGIAWDYAHRGLINEVQEWSERLIRSGEERDDPRALALAHWTLSWANIVVGWNDEAIAHARTCIASALTPFDQTLGLVAEASAEIFRGATPEGLARLQQLRRRTEKNGWLIVDAAMDIAEGVGLAVTGDIQGGIRLLRTSIAVRDQEGLRTIAAWSRIALAEVYLEILTGTQRPPVMVLLRNLPTLLAAKLVGARRARLLLEEASTHDQLSPRGAIRARIEMDLGVLDKLDGKYLEAKRHLGDARVSAALQKATPLVARIDAALATL